MRHNHIVIMAGGVGSRFWPLSPRKVVVHGLDGYIVSEKNGQLLVCKRSEEQRIRDFSV